DVDDAGVPAPGQRVVGERGGGKATRVRDEQPRQLLGPVLGEERGLGVRPERDRDQVAEEHHRRAEHERAAIHGEAPRRSPASAAAGAASAVGPSWRTSRTSSTARPMPVVAVSATASTGGVAGATTRIMPSAPPAVARPPCLRTLLVVAPVATALRDAT